MTRKTTAGLAGISLAVLVMVLNMLSDNGYKVVPKSYTTTCNMQVLFDPSIIDSCYRIGVYTPGPGVWGLFEPGMVMPCQVGVVADPDTGLYFDPTSIEMPDTTCYLTLERM